MAGTRDNTVGLDSAKVQQPDQCQGQHPKHRDDSVWNRLAQRLGDGQTSVLGQGIQIVPGNGFCRHTIHRNLAIQALKSLQVQ